MNFNEWLTLREATEKYSVLLVEEESWLDIHGDPVDFSDYPMTFKRLPNEYWASPPKDLPQWAYVNPAKVTKFDRDQAQLEAFLLFAIFVAGKGSDDMKQRLWRVLHFGEGDTPFERLRYLAERRQLRRALIAAGTGKYNEKTRAIMSLLRAVEDGKLDLRTVTREQLLMFPGIKAKTASFFITHTRPNQQMAVIDTHVLNWMRAVLKAWGDRRWKDVPKSTPPIKVYKEWEPIFFEIANKLGYKGAERLAELDLRIWRAMSSRQPWLAPGLEHSKKGEEFVGNRPKPKPVPQVSEPGAMRPSGGLRPIRYKKLVVRPSKAQLARLEEEPEEGP